MPSFKRPPDATFDRAQEPNRIVSEADAAAERGAERRVVKYEEKVDREVAEFRFARLQSSTQGSYAATKARFGPLAATDPDRTAKHDRFRLNPLLRDPLSVEEEERRVVEEKVQERVSAVAEEVRRAAAQDGYRDGLAKGHEEAFMKFRTESTTRLTALDGLLAELEQAKSEIFRANERYLIELVFRLSRLILLREVKIDREYLTRLTRSLIERIGVRDKIHVRVHPDDSATLGLLREGLEKSLGTLKNLTIETSAQVARGGCQVETEWNAIDASVETQLQGLHEALIGGPATEPTPAVELERASEAEPKEPAASSREGGESEPK